jgi:2-iminobutanoate/2-iminopropanoate deaminase
MTTSNKENMATGTPAKTAIATSAAPSAIGPYSQAIVSGNHVFLSGQIAIDPATSTLLDGDAATQAHQVMKNLAAVLNAADCGLENLVKTGIFLKDMNDFAAVNAVYASYLTEPYPARATVQVSRLPKDVLVEIDGVAVR